MVDDEGGVSRARAVDDGRVLGFASPVRHQACFLADPPPARTGRAVPTPAVSLAVAGSAMYVELLCLNLYSCDFGAAIARCLAPLDSVTFTLVLSSLSFVA